MISILLVQSDSYQDLVAEWEAWHARYGKAPALIVGHDDLCYAIEGKAHSSRRGDRAFFRGIAVVTLADLRELHGASLSATGAYHGLENAYL